LIITPIVVRMFGWTPSATKPRTIVSIMRIAAWLMLAPKLTLSMRLERRHPACFSEAKCRTVTGLYS
jgi:hypothetical protein